MTTGSSRSLNPLTKTALSRSGTSTMLIPPAVSSMRCRLVGNWLMNENAKWACKMAV